MVKRKTIKKGSGVVDYIKELGSTNYTKYTNLSRKTLEQYGKYKIVKIMVFRKEILKELEAVLNFVSLNNSEEAKKTASIDKLFHVGLLLTVNNDAGQFFHIICEKTSQPDIFKVSFNVEKYGVQMVVPLKDKNISLNEFVEKAKNENSKSFFEYDALGVNGLQNKSNCQDFVKLCLKANNLNSPSLEAFYYQDLKKLVEGIPKTTAKNAKITTSLGSWFNKLIGKGEGGKKKVRFGDDAYTDENGNNYQHQTVAQERSNKGFKYNFDYSIGNAVWGVVKNLLGGKKAGAIPKSEREKQRKKQKEYEDNIMNNEKYDDVITKRENNQKLQNSKESQEKIKEAQNMTEAQKKRYLRTINKDAKKQFDDQQEALK